LGVSFLAPLSLRNGLPFAAGCYTIMRSWGLHKDALAAWIVFQESLQALRQDGEALGDLCGRIQVYFRRHWVRPAGFMA
jgi:hypothetical protein